MQTTLFPTKDAPERLASSHTLCTHTGSRRNSRPGSRTLPRPSPDSYLVIGKANPLLQIQTVRCPILSAATHPSTLPMMDVSYSPRVFFSFPAIGLLGLHYRIVPSLSIRSPPPSPPTPSWSRLAKHFQNRSVSSPAPVTTVCPSGLIARYSTR